MRPCLKVVCNIHYAVAAFQRPQTVAAGVYLHLRHELLSGTLAPGTWLREQELAEALKVSRTPVREAVRQLAQEGLVVMEPNRGVRVPNLSLAEAVHTYAVREPLEAMA
ncbi:MAG: GntR family transcriptional regulator, partial [Trueperaceae bacterium]|nr:GntR family transcriptional regulator [Trueperaceae bacterium]